jgi:DNA ligase-3
MGENRYSVDYAKLGTSSCKKCKTKIAKGEIRIAKITPSPFSEGDTMKIYHHVPCIFDTFLHARATTKIIESSTDIDGWTGISPLDREIILERIKEVQTARANKPAGKSPTKKPAKSAPPVQTKITPSIPVSIVDDDDESTIDNNDIEIIDDTKKDTEEKEEITTATTDGVHVPLGDDPKHPDNSFRQFRALCTKIAETNGHLAKTSIVEQFITYGSDGEIYKGNLSLLFHLLLPSKGYKSIIYNLKAKQLCKLFSIIFHANANSMIQKCEETGGKKTKP